MMLQLNPPLPVNTTTKGKGLAHFVINDSIEHHLYWVIFCDNGEIWTLSNTEVRADSNETWGRVNYYPGKIHKYSPLTDIVTVSNKFHVGSYVRIKILGRKTYVQCVTAEGTYLLTDAKAPGPWYGCDLESVESNEA